MPGPRKLLEPKAGATLKLEMPEDPAQIICPLGSSTHGLRFDAIANHLN